MKALHAYPLKLKNNAHEVSIVGILPVPFSFPSPQETYG